MNPILFQLWAKSDPFHPLPCHMLDVGNVALALLEAEPFRTTANRFAAATGCPEQQVKPWLAYLTSLHDLGKCHRRFQAKGPDQLLTPLIAAGLVQKPLDEPFRHEVVSARWVQSHLKSVCGWRAPAAVTVAAALRAHHGNFRAEEDKDEESEAEAGQWEPLRRNLSEQLWETFGPGDWKADFRDHSVAGILLCGLLVLSDWIASNPDLFAMTHAGEPLAEYAARSRDEARKAVRGLGFDGASPWRSGQSFQQVWPKIKSPNGLQLRIEEVFRSGVAPGLAIIEAPMGEGKTEAAIYLATRWMEASGQTGLYVALPTAATSNQMHGRVREFLAHHDPLAAATTRLVHGTAWLLDEATPERLPEVSGASSADTGVALDWFRPRKRTLLALNGVGTIDQAHMSVLHVPFGFLRLFGLAGKVLIIDEVHAYDAYMSEFLEHLLRWCRALAVPVILLSATLPATRRQALVQAYAPDAHLRSDDGPYPLITVVGSDGTVREESGFRATDRPAVRLIQHPGYLGDPERIAAMVADRARQGGCIGVIASTVASAQAIFRALRDELPDGQVELILFHARFTAERRQAVEQAVLDRLDKRSLDPAAPDYRPRPKKLVLVATQVVEQSLDLDFDELFTELAPIDLLLQRMGRLWRHLNRPDRGGRQTADLHVFLPAGPDGSLRPAGDVYSAFILKQTHQVLAGREAVALPGDLRDLVGQVYDHPPTADSLLWLEWQKLQEELECARKQAQTYLIPDPKPNSFVLADFDQYPRDENEGEAASYMAVRTRQGDYTRSILALEGGAFRGLLAADRPPGREVLKAIYLRSVSLPAWWFSQADPAPGYEPLIPAKKWLPGYAVLRLRDGRWEGSTAKGEHFKIVDDPVLGFLREERTGA